jgi:hypothetical protein
MRSSLLVLVAAAVALPAAAVDIVMRDGTVIEATTYTVTGSYVMLTLADGRKVAYDPADVDLDHLRALEAAAAPPAPEPKGRESIRDATASTDGQSAFTLTDDDVGHVGRTAAAAKAAEAEEAAAADQLPAGVNEGGRVTMQGVSLDEVTPGVWEVTGEVVNRTPAVASSVRLEMEALSDSGTVLDEATIPVAEMIEPGKKVEFTHRFEVESRPVPRARVLWMGPEAAGGAEPPAGDQQEGAEAAPEVPDL